jgi:hypothetical protein
MWSEKMATSTSSVEKMEPQHYPEDATRIENAHQLTNDQIPRIPLDLREHKVSIGVTWSILLLSSGILPVILYFVLRYGANLKLQIGMYLFFYENMRWHCN